MLDELTDKLYVSLQNWVRLTLPSLACQFDLYLFFFNFLEKAALTKKLHLFFSLLTRKTRMCKYFIFTETYFPVGCLSNTLPFLVAVTT